MVELLVFMAVFISTIICNKLLNDDEMFKCWAFAALMTELLLLNL